MKLKYFYVVSLLAVNSIVVADEVSGNAIQIRIAQAESLHAEAQAANHGWASTRELIIAAKTALEHDRLVEADALSKRALQTSTGSVAQALQEKQTWRSRVPRREDQ